MKERENDVLSPCTEADEETRKRTTPFARNVMIAFLLFLVAVSLLVLWLVFRPDNKKESYSLLTIEAISELTTVQCRYHNVSVYEDSGGLLGFGSQYVWFEYDVIVDVGIDVNQVRIEQPDEAGIVRIYLPPAEIQGAEVVEETVSKPVHQLGWFASLSPDEETAIMKDGVEKLKNDAETKAIITQADASAKNIIEKYVKNMGTLIGENYTVEWMEDPNIAPNSTEA